MANKIQFRRGLRNNLPVLSAGEPALCTDSQDIYIGSSLGNIQMAKMKQVLERDVKNKLYKKTVYKQLPLLFPDYQALVTQEAVTYLYPQSFTIDWDSQEIFILYSPTGGASTKRWIIVYNLQTGVYKSCFQAGNGGGEGIVVKKEGLDRFLYVKTTGTSIGKFFLNNLPANKAVLNPTVSHDVGLFYNFSYNNGEWLVEQDGASLGSIIRRTSFSVYDDNFALKKTMTIGVMVGGPWVGDYVSYIPKRQGIALGDNLIVQGSGGVYIKGSAVTPYAYHGVKILNGDGELVSEGVIDPELMITTLENEGYVCTRIESEGVHISPEKDVYSIVIHQDRFDSSANTAGIIIFKELSGDDDAIDFSNISKIYTKINPAALESGIFPRSGDGKMYDPFTGALLDTLEKILDFMSGLDLKQFSFYSSASVVKDISDIDIPSSNLVTIKNANNVSFFVDYTSATASKKYQIYGTSGARIQNQIFPSYSSKTLALSNGATAYDVARTPKLIIKADGTRELTGLLNNTPKDGALELTTLDTDDRPIKNMNFVVALTSSTAGGYASLSVLTSGRIVVNYVSSASLVVSLDGVNWLTTI